MDEIFTISITQSFPFCISLIIFYSVILKLNVIKKYLTSVIRERDIHKSPTPKIGGIGIFLMGSIYVIIYIDISITISLFIVYFFILGLIDDLKEIKSGILKIIAFIIPIVLLLALDSGINNTNLTFSWYQKYIFGIILIFVSINGTNTIDGIDLLSGLVSWITIFALGLIAFKYKFEIEFKICCLTCVLLIPFLFFNAPKANLFLGDSGTLLIGSIIGIISYNIWIKSNEMSYYLFGILGLSLIDMISVSINRILLKKLPWKADKTHFHHIFIKIFGKNIALIPLIFIHILVVLTFYLIAVKYISLKESAYTLYVVALLCVIIRHNQLIKK